MSRVFDCEMDDSPPAEGVYHSLAALLSDRQLAIFLLLLQEAKTRTGYGDIHLVIQDGRVVLIKGTTSWR